MQRPLFPCIILFLAACGGDGGSADDAGRDSLDAARRDAGTVQDAAMIPGDAAVGDDASVDGGDEGDAATLDAAVAGDSGAGDGGAGDSGSGDGGAGDGGPSEGDAGTDGGPADSGAEACHDLVLGGDVVVFEAVETLPTPSGGAIPLGTYDLARVRTGSGLEGTMAVGTWRFAGDGTVETLDSVNTAGAPDAPEPRTSSYDATGTDFVRTLTCGAEGTREGEYSVRTEEGTTFFDLHRGALVFTYQRR